MPGQAASISLQRRGSKSAAAGASKRGGEPDINVEGAQVRDGRVPLAAADRGDGQPGRQRETRAGRAGQRRGPQLADQISGLGDRDGRTAWLDPECPAMPWTLQAGAQYARGRRSPRDPGPG